MAPSVRKKDLRPLTLEAARGLLSETPVKGMADVIWEPGYPEPSDQVCLVIYTDTQRPPFRCDELTDQLGIRHTQDCRYVLVTLVDDEVRLAYNPEQHSGGMVGPIVARHKLAA